MIRINITITERLLGPLDQEADKRQISRSELLRYMLEDRYNAKPGFAQLTNAELATWDENSHD
jgi:metal-responsive CopG/Arc/MetJ family transcriptional regulator